MRLSGKRRKGMQIYRYSSSQKLLSESVVALGFFDGVHAGHRSLLKSAQAIATEKGLTFTVFTFPAEASLKGDGVIYSTEQKLEILDSLGVEAVVLADFASLCAVSPTDFVNNVLIGDLGCKVAVCGEDFRFGHRAAGDAMLLQRLLSESGRSCICII